ncbi:MAG: hypothetical protein V4678_02455 [Patescibacteria group bacterium]
MKDIDFDELDKAVSSLMANTGPAKVPAADASTQTAPSLSPSLNPVSSPLSTPVTDISAPVSPAPVEVVPAASIVNTPSSAPARPSVPAARRGGRFMDMVSSPGADMKPRITPPMVKPTMTPSPSREGLSITPRQDSVVDAGDASSTAPADTQPLGATEQSAPSYDVMPDPIDMNVEPAPATSEPVDETVSAPLGPIESPFLTNTKVEKRPLNSGNFELPVETPAYEPGQSADLESEDETPVSDEQKGRDEPPVNPQIPELSSDLVAIESNEKFEVTQAVDTTEAASQVDAPSTPLGATSIAQQYKTTASSGDQSHAAIYDSSQYPDPVSHPAKSKSGWLWVLWVALLLGVGAGGAVVLYTLGIIP